MIKIQIKSTFGSLLFEHESENNTIKETVEKAIADRADLRYANLQNADLRYANLQYTDLRSTNLQSADLRYADLRCADLRLVDLRSADLQYADLRYADLQYADLRSAKNWQDTEWANQAKQNILFILSHLKSEVPWLRQALIDGKINGMQYEWECCCLIGTISKKKGIYEVCNTIPFYTKWLHNPAEQFFYQIRESDTPKNSEFSKMAVELCDMVLNS